MAKKLVVEIREDKIIGIEGEFKNKTFEIFKYAEVPAEEEFYYSKQANIFTRQEQALSQLLKNLKTKTKKLNIIVPDHLTFNHFTILPKLKEKEIYSAVKFQADQFIPLPLEEVELDLDILEETVDKKKLFILIVGIEKNIINKLTALCESLAIIPERIENQLSSLGKTFTYSNLDNTPDSMLINFSKKYTTLYFFNNKRKLIFNTHSFKLGYEIFFKELALSTNISIEEAAKLLKEVGIVGEGGKIGKVIKVVLEEFINEIKQSLVAAQAQHNLIIKNFAFLGEKDLVKDLDKFIAASINLQPFEIDLSKTIKTKLSLPHNVITSVGGLI